MAFISLIAAALAACQVASAYLVAPAGTAFPGASSECSAWVYGTSSSTCEKIESEYNITLTQFATWNPTLFQLSSTCAIVPGYYYCVEIDFESTVTSTTSTTFVTSAASTVTGSTSTEWGDGLTTPSPIQTGMTNICYEYHLVVSGDTCASIASSAGISVSSLYSWNPAVGTSCTDLVVGDYVCTRVLGYGISSSAYLGWLFTTTTTTSTATTTASTGDGVSTPAPIQTGMTSTCDSFYLVVSGDSCAGIADSEGISLTNFYAWNPAVGSSCASLGLGDYVCVGVIGSTSTATVTTTGDGVSTPSPIQTGTVSSCDSFYLVVSGDSCSSIAENEGISLTNFYAWNPAVGSSCASLGLGDYVCVGVLGSATATTTGDGVSTPSPIQTGMVSTCDSFYLVVSGDSCAGIADSEDISLTDFYAWNPAVGSSCASLGLGDYVCIGVIGGATATTTTATSTTASSTGVVTPSPVQTGMVSGCDAFYYTVDGDDCPSIAAAEGVTVAELEEWNPAIGTDCTNLWLEVYICVGVS